MKHHFKQVDSTLKQDESKNQNCEFLAAKTSNLTESTTEINTDSTTKFHTESTDSQLESNEESVTDSDVENIIAHLHKAGHHSVAEFFIDMQNFAKDAQDTITETKAILQGTLDGMGQAVWIWQDDEIYYLNERARGLYPIVAHFAERIAGDIAQLDGTEVELGERQFLLLAKKVSSRIRLLQATDITEQKVQERYASMGQVSAHLSHEIRTPISAILMLLKSLEKVSDLGELSRHVELLNGAAKQLENIVESTLAFTRETRISKSSIDLGELKGAISRIFSEFESGAELVLEGFCGKILADRTLLEVVFRNFISNALDAIFERRDDEASFLGCVKIEARILKGDGLGGSGGDAGFGLNGGAVEFLISDDGAEISNIKDLFTPWKTGKLKGTGLGLAYCQRIIHHHGGEIKLLDEHKKLFQIIIPQ